MKKLLIIEGTIALSIIAIIIYVQYIGYFPQCYFRENYGIFCPSCNFTRCGLTLMTLNIGLAFEYQPILTIAIIYLFIVNILYIFNTITGKTVLKQIYPKPWYLIVFAVLLILYALYMNISGKA